MSLFLSAVALLTLALLASSKRFYRLRRSRLAAGAIAGGWIAVLVGVLLGPFASGLVSPDAVLRATPLLSVGLGWIGLMIGLQARRDVLTKLPRVIWRLSLIDAALSVVIIGAIAWLAIASARGSLTQTPPLAVALFATAAIGWSMETRSLGLDASSESQRHAVLLRASGGLCAILAVASFGIVAGVLPSAVAPVEGSEAGAFGSRLGALALACAIAPFLALLAREAMRLAGRQRAEMLVVFLGVVALAAGISASLGVTPLLPAMITGATLANLRSTQASADTAVFGRFILQAEHVVATLFALLAGVLLDPRLTLVGLSVAGALVLARLLTKPALYAILSTEAPSDADAPSHAAARRAPLRQSPVAMALAVSLFILAPEPASQRLLAIVVLVGLASDILATIAIRRASGGTPTAPRGDRP